MLSVLYIAMVALPLTLAGVALLIIAVRAAGRRVADRDEHEGLVRRTPTALASPPSNAGLAALREMDIRRSLLRALDPDAEAPARRVASSRRQAAPLREGPLPAGVETKECPDCAETVLAAARICKHCRYRFDGEQDVVADEPRRSVG